MIDERHIKCKQAFLPFRTAHFLNVYSHLGLLKATTFPLELIIIKVKGIIYFDTSSIKTWITYILQCRFIVNLYFYLRFFFLLNQHKQVLNILHN